MSIADEIKEYIDTRIEAVRQEAMAEQKKTLKYHFNYCVSHAGFDPKFTWLRNELFGKEV